MSASNPAALRPRELLAAAALAAALALGHARFGQDLHDVLPLLGLYLLAALAAWYDGVRGGAVAVAAALAAIVFWPGLRVQIGLAGCALFLAGASALVWIAATLRRRRNRLRLQQEQWSAVLAGVGDGVALIGRDARVLYLNPAAGRLLDVAPEHARGRLAGDVFDGWPQALPDRAGPLRLRGAGDKPLQAEAVPLQGPRDAFSGHAVFLREPRGAEEGMSERRLRAVFDTDLWGVCFADVQGGRWWANPGFERMLAPAADESAPMRTQSLEQLGVPAELLQRLRSEGAFEPVEVALPERGGEPSWMLLAGEALSEHDIALLALDIGERKRSDAALRAQRLLMRALIDRIPALVAYVDARQRYRLCNRAYRRWFGDRRLQGLPLRDAHPAPELAPYLPLLERAFAGQAVRFPVELSRRGAQRHFDVQFVPHRPEGDGIEGVVVHALDVTARVEAARRVEASERRFRSLAVAGAGMVWYADAAGRLLDAPGWEDLTGQARAQARGEGWLGAVDPLDRERVRSAWHEHLRAAEPELLDLEFRVLSAHGEARHVVLRAVPVTDNAGKVLEWIGGLRDVHERRLFEEQLRHAEAEQHALLDNLPKMVWIAEPDGSIRYQNRRWYEYTGLGGDQDWRDICHPDDLADGLRSWDEAIRNGRPLNVELRFRRAGDGQYRWHIVRGQPLLDPHGRLRCWYGASTDIEDQKRALEMMAAANQRVSHFLAVLSHELRNPLSSVAAAGELLQRTDLDAPQRERALATLARQNRHVQRMVEDLLDIARVTQGGMELRREPLDLRALLEEVREDNLARADAAGVVFDPIEGLDLAPVYGDRARLRQVFDNLVSNAIKASEPGQRIGASLQRAPLSDGAAGLGVQVCDQGLGLDRDIAGNLFEPFVQTPDWRSRGLGLGLSIVKTLVERHGGQVAARSEGPGSGSCFEVRLPLAAAPAADSADSADSAPAPAAAAPARRGRVLIVDDEADTADALATLLALDGHRVRVAGDGEQALSLWSEEPAEVVLCDLELPGPLNGYDVARALRAAPRTPYLIAYSGYGQAEDRERTREVGFDEHLIKPASIDRIQAALQRGLGQASSKS
ncbi:hybrid sensor histidine kinase/response regulator [Lysobacter enzymogenes]|uniref:hybrid sensor histidine kinase/response regulator n=1 Tax=Lysobacter enzymogenes TaxID=69 RepID=UPI001AF2A494|nr:PAS domain S-box protein [Lysobacter enzymogenes]QQQ02769.1 PAS domain S-box protein [Lysobacter enzymogenes]